jgi:hypothetical protein
VKQCEGFGELLAAALFVNGSFARGKLLEVRDQALAVGDAVGTDLMGDDGLEDLLGAPAADAEEFFQGGAVDPGVGKSFKLGDYRR